MPSAIRLASALFFFSGAAALIFEALWFRRAGLAFGNSVWASALVLSSFMAGMAVGNAVAARYAARLRSPLRTYGVLEVVIAIVGIALVAILPMLGPALAPIFEPLLPTPWLLQPLRFAIAFAVMVAPAVAMGATLPVLIHALRERDSDFGHLLGRLYGWNTLGAMFGAASAELIWIQIGGIWGSAAIAALLNLAAAAGALVLRRQLAESRAEITSSAESPPASTGFEANPSPRSPLSARAWRLLAATAASGAIALAFEVVWFRIVIQYLPNSSAMFAWMLAVVLGGIALGSLAASAAFRFWPHFDKAAPAVAALACALAVLSHSTAPMLWGPWIEAMEALEAPPGAVIIPTPLVLVFCSLLMLPVSIASGALFAMIGKRLEDELRVAGRATGLLALANSGGAAVGPLIAGFILLPEFGVDASSLGLAAGYLVVAALAWSADSLRAPAAAAALLGVVALFLFPHGEHERTLVRLVRAEYGQDEKIIALREGIVETAIVTRTEWNGEPIAHRLVTDGYSMSATRLAARRYMRLFAYLPAAFHPGPESAVLISFGVGNTADALTELTGRDGVTGMKEIHVVDISPEILSLADVIHPDASENPLNDERVQVHIEDGRYFLQTTPGRFDIITAEPPPPAFAGVVNLYTREYFELIHERLNPGGFASYWLPVSQMRPFDAKAIVLAFCEAFPDCTLWESAPTDFILLGSRDATTPVTHARVKSIWNHPRSGPELRKIGVESAAQLGATFLADRPYLLRWASNAKPLVDAHPERAPRVASTWADIPPEFTWIRDARSNAERFRQSEVVRTLWPAALIEESYEAFKLANLMRSALLGAEKPFSARLQEMHAILTQTSYESPVLWTLEGEWILSDAAERIAARGDSTPEIERELGLAALAQRRFSDAAAHLQAAASTATPSNEAILACYALAAAGRPAEARALANDTGTIRSSEHRELWLLIEGWFEPGA